MKTRQVDEQEAHQPRPRGDVARDGLEEACRPALLELGPWGLGRPRLDYDGTECQTEFGPYLLAAREPWEVLGVDRSELVIALAAVSWTLPGVS